MTMDTGLSSLQLEGRVGSRTPKFSADPEVSATLPSHYYYDTEIFAREQVAIWFRTWQFVGLLSDVKESGDYFTAAIGNQLLFVVRGKDGVLRAFYNVCKHRGHTLVEGKGSTRLVVCPYHSWGYGLDGALRTAPHTQNVIDFDRSDFPLTEVRVDTLGFMVFVNLDPEAEPLADFAGTLLDDFRACIPQFDDLVPIQTDTVDVAANWKLIHDGIECYHCPHIHPQLMGKDGFADSSWDTTVERNWSRHVSHLKRNDENGEPINLPWGVDELAVENSYVWYLWPNMSLVARPGAPNFQIIRTLADAPDKSRREVLNFTLRADPTQSELDMFRWWRELAWEQDRAAIEQQQLGVVSRGYSQGRLVVDPAGSWFSEHGTHHFQYLVWCALHDLPYEWGGKTGDNAE